MFKWQEEIIKLKKMRRKHDDDIGNENFVFIIAVLIRDCLF